MKNSKAIIAALSMSLLFGALNTSAFAEGKSDRPVYKTEVGTAGDRLSLDALVSDEEKNQLNNLARIRSEYDKKYEEAIKAYGEMDEVYDLYDSLESKLNQAKSDLSTLEQIKDQKLLAVEDQRKLSKVHYDKYQELLQKYRSDIENNREAKQLADVEYQKFLEYGPIINSLNDEFYAAQDEYNTQYLKVESLNKKLNETAAKLNPLIAEYNEKNAEFEKIKQYRNSAEAKLKATNDDSKTQWDGTNSGEVFTYNDDEKNIKPSEVFADQNENNDPSKQNQENGTRTITENQEIGFNIERIANNKLKPGEEKVTRHGSNGLKVVNVIVKTNDDGTTTVINSNEKIVTEPVNEIVEYGPSADEIRKAKRNAEDIIEDAVLSTPQYKKFENALDDINTIDEINNLVEEAKALEASVKEAKAKVNKTKYPTQAEKTAYLNRINDALTVEDVKNIASQALKQDLDTLISINEDDIRHNLSRMRGDQREDLIARLKAAETYEDASEIVDFANDFDEARRDAYWEISNAEKNGNLSKVEAEEYRKKVDASDTIDQAEELEEEIKAQAKSNESNVDAEKEKLANDIENSKLSDEAKSSLTDKLNNADNYAKLEEVRDEFLELELGAAIGEYEEKIDKLENLNDVEKTAYKDSLKEATSSKKLLTLTTRL